MKKSLFSQSALLIVLTSALLLASGTSGWGRLTTWEEDIGKAKALEDKHQFAEAERCYITALASLEQSRAHLPKPTQADSQRLGETLEGLLRVLCAENKWTSAIGVTKALMTLQQDKKWIGRVSAAELRANYGTLIEKAESNKRWPKLEPLFTENRFIGMNRSRVHGILGRPDSAVEKDKYGQPRSTTTPMDYRMNCADAFPAKDMPNPGNRDFYILSVLLPDAEAPSVAMLKAHFSFGPGGHTEGVFSVLDVDYVDDHVTRYRLRSRDHTGDWASDNQPPQWPGGLAL